MTKIIPASEYIVKIRKNFSMYTLTNRAIPSMCDGLKPSARRLIWMAKNGSKYKSATLAGSVMPLHPHAAPESVVNTLAAPYGNNIPLLTGYGAFGTLLAPDAFSASRYTSVALSSFTTDAILVDMELVPMQENYDSTLMEPTHFLPLVPVVLLNPNEGIAVGYSCNILPRTLTDVIEAQLEWLSTKTISKPIIPYISPINQRAVNKNDRWIFTGTVKRINSTTVQITNLPYGLTHNQFVTSENSKLYKLLEEGVIVEYTDRSRNVYDIEVKFPRAVLNNLSDQQLIDKLGLVSSHSENITVLNDTHTNVIQISIEEIIQQFTDWRLKWFKKRYELLVEQVKQKLQQAYDVITAIDNHAGKIAPTKKDRKEYCQWLESIGIVNIDYIAQLATYRYTLQERDKVEKLINQHLKELDEYNSIINSDVKQRNIYKKELTHILSKYA